MILIEDVLFYHSIMIEQHGGSHGVRDIGALESAIARPFMTFDGQELYLTAIEKASALIESIAKNHPFVDGNKRTSFYLAIRLLNDNNVDINAPENDTYDFVINVASGLYSYEDILAWLRANTIQIS
jgi:death-on-curing protein